MLTIASLHIHPIKSLGGFGVNEARITARGFEHDRRWMLVDEAGVFITQRELPLMALLHCSPLDEGFRVTDIRDGGTIDLPWTIDRGEVARARIWKDEVEVIHAPVEVSAWFADRLDRTCSLVHMPEGSMRPINPKYANGITALNDGYPYMILSQASVDDLDQRISANGHMPQWSHGHMERFRPSIVIAGGEAYQEDQWKEITIGTAVPFGRQARFSLVKPCERCVITTTDQRTGERDKEPLRTLAAYRRLGNEVEFGMNAVAVGGGVVRVGDEVKV